MPPRIQGRVVELIRYYPKINAPFMRDEKGRFVKDQWADPVFERHQDDEWSWYYKWDGTNVGMTTDGWFGRSERSMFTAEQADCLDRWYTNKRDSLLRLESGLEYLYGELVGPGVQGNPHDFAELAVVEFERWDVAPHPYGLFWPATLNEMLTDHRNHDVWFGEHYYYVEGFVGRLVSDPSVATKIKVKDKWSD